MGTEDNTDITSLSMGATPMAAAAEPIDPMIKPASTDPGETTRYTIDFSLTEAFQPGIHQLTIKLEDFGVPDEIANSRVTVAVKPGTESFNASFNPENVTVDGDDIILDISNLNPNDIEEGDPQSVEMIAGATVKIVIDQTAGVSNPTEADDYKAVISYGAVEIETADLNIPLIVKLDEDDAGRGKDVIATGKGFKNGTEIVFWLDMNKDGMMDDDETPLCRGTVDGDDVGSCGFTISNPPFMPGVRNFINARDGEGGYAMPGAPITDDTEDDDIDSGNAHQFELTDSITVSPAGGNPGSDYPGPVA